MFNDSKAHLVLFVYFDSSQFPPKKAFATNYFDYVKFMKIGHLCLMCGIFAAIYYALHAKGMRVDVAHSKVIQHALD